LFLYPSSPEIIANTIEHAIEQLNRAEPAFPRISWKRLGVSGQIIFCEICKALRFTQVVVADVTTLNFNLLFEIGYALGLGLPVIPIRDTSFIKDEKVFGDLGLLDTLGYLDFNNSQALVQGILHNKRPVPISRAKVQVDKERPLFLMKSHISTEGMVKLMSSIKKSGLRFRTFDPRETSRLSLLDALKQVASSLGILVHLMSLERMGALAHNARCAFIAGLGMAAGKHVLMLQESGGVEIQQPLDYRDVVKSYSNPAKVPDLLIPLVRQVVGTLQETRFVPISLPLKELEKLDLGDLAAENEIKLLRSYFVPTAEYNEAKRGRGRLVVGRKGTGKTAIFYGIRSAYKPSHSHLVLDLKPEGHQFTKLREAVLPGFTPGVQQHVFTAFWNYLLLMELAHKIVHDEYFLTLRNQRLRAPYARVQETYGFRREEEQGDFSERLLRLVDEIAGRKNAMRSITATSEVTELIYGRSIAPLREALGEYLSNKDDVWLLFDNLDKGWPVHGAREEDITLLRSLLEATRKLQRQLERRGVEFHTVVFIRNDIYEHLLRETPDKGKDTAIILDWRDVHVFKELIRRRMMTSTDARASFDELWPYFFDTHVGGEESFTYILSRTLRRPRELLRFARECINVAVNRGHEKVSEEDILHAEKTCSDDALVDISAELNDVSPTYADVPYAFIGTRAVLARGELDSLLRDRAGVAADEVARVLDLLLWFGFLGVHIYPDFERYSYMFQHNPKKMRTGMTLQDGYCIHPAFRKALGCVEY
jgi:hypothetical protein